MRRRRDTIKQETFFLPLFDLFYLLVVGVQCYFCTSSQSVTHKRARARTRAHTHTHTHTHTECVGLHLTRDRPVAETTQHSQQQNILAPGGIRARNVSKRAAADLRLRPKAETVRKSARSCRHSATIETGRSLVFFRRRAFKHRKIYTKCVRKILLFGYEVKMGETAIQCGKWWRVESV